MALSYRGLASCSSWVGFSLILASLSVAAQAPVFQDEGASGDILGRFVNSAGDFDSDGLSDFVASRQTHKDGSGREIGAFTVYFGNADASMLDSVTVEGTEEGSNFGASCGLAGDVNNDGFDDLLVGAFGAAVIDTAMADTLAGAGKVYLYFGNAERTLSNPVVLEGTAASASFGRLCITAGDLDGDSFDDFVVGSSDYSDGEDQEGRIDVFYGGQGPNWEPSWTFQSNFDHGRLGIAGGGAGDINGDFFSDLIIGAPGADSDEGYAYLFLGGPTRRTGEAVPDQTLDSNDPGARFGAAAYRAGDVNGDEFGDVIIGSPNSLPGVSGKAQIFYGSGAGTLSLGATLTGAWPGGEFGASVCTAGDFNQDGYADVLIGEPSYVIQPEDERVGRVVLHLGGPDGPDPNAELELLGEQAGGLFGISLSGVGDINGNLDADGSGDGYSDFIVGDSAGGRGRVYAYLGRGLLPKEEPDWRVDAFDPGAQFSVAISPAGDVNADGVDDVIVGAQANTPAETPGKAFIFTGVSGGLSELPIWIGTGDGNDDVYGSRVAGIGDMNSDGISDFAVSAFYADSGAVYIYLGGADLGPDTEPWATLTGEQLGSEFGAGLAGVGDVDKDGFADLLVGAPRYGIGSDTTMEGRIYLYRGQTDQPELAWTYDGSQPGEFFGSVCGMVGDTNRDEFSDFIVAAPGYDSSDTTNVGRVVLFYGNGGAQPDSVWALEGTDPGEQFGLRIATSSGVESRDFNGDGFGDLAFTRDNPGNGSASIVVYAGTATVPEPNMTIYEPGGGGPGDIAFGESITCAGDLDGDGFVELAVGASAYDDDQGQEVGAVFVYRGQGNQGTAPILSATPDLVLFGEQQAEAFGWTVAGVGDPTDDGFEDIMVGSLRFDINGDEMGDGRLSGYFGNGGGGPAISLRQYQENFSSLIDIQGRTVSNAVNLAIEGRVSGGRTLMRAEYQIAPIADELEEAPILLGNWEDSGVVGDSAYVTLTELASELVEDTRHQWRMRVAFDDPYFPRTRWFSPSRSGVREADFRTSGNDTSGLTTVAAAASLRLPTPVTARSRIQFFLENPGPTSVELLSVDGRRVLTLRVGDLEPGYHDVPWSQVDRGLSSGVYWVRVVQDGRHIGTGKTIKVK